MTTYSKLNFVYRLQKWMDSVPGQTFLNYAYSWGASIVILGTLFKLTHLPGANFFLFLGMGTEVFVFFISAFDRPFDKTADGMELDVHPGATVLGNVGGTGGVIEGSVEGSVEGSSEGNGGTVVIGGGGGGGTVIIGGGGGAPIVGGNVPMPSVDEAPVVDTEAIAAVSSSVVTMSGGTGVIGGPIGGSVPPINPELEEATTNYVDELKRLTEMLARVSAQSERLAHDSEEMENLNRTLTGITKVYEMQLKSASAQIGTIDDINEQTKKMAAQILELNKIYARMIEAMTAKLNV
jgi:hypothetical protein